MKIVHLNMKRVQKSVIGKRNLFKKMDYNQSPLPLLICTECSDQHWIAYDTPCLYLYFDLEMIGTVIRKYIVAVWRI